MKWYKTLMPVLPSEFEEKEYEAPLYNQIERTTGLVWSPGQVFEEHIGIDRAIYISDPEVWEILGFHHRRGILLEDFSWRHIWRHRARRPLPNFKLNLFIQAKRCFYHTGHPRRLKNTAIGSPCWRFDIEQHQQQALEKVADKIDRRAVVCYAAPAFHRLTQLYAHTAAGTVNQFHFPHSREVKRAQRMVL